MSDRTERLPAGPREVTARQLEVARLVAEGRTNEQIADALGISHAGAKYHVSELLGRLGLTRRDEIRDWYSQHRSTRRRRALLSLPLGALVAAGGVAALAVAAVVLLLVPGDARNSSAPWLAVRPISGPPVAPHVSFAGDGSVLFAGSYSTQGDADDERDLAISRFSPDGELVWERALAGAGRQHPTALAVSDSIFVAGTFVGVVESASERFVSNGASDVFVAAYSMDGHDTWFRQFGDFAGDELVTSMSPSRDGGVILAGWFGGEMEMDGLSIRTDSDREAFVARLSRQGEAQWLTGLPGLLTTAPRLLLAVEPTTGAAVVGVVEGAGSAMLGMPEGGVELRLFRVAPDGRLDSTLVVHGHDIVLEALGFDDAQSAVAVGNASRLDVPGWNGAPCPDAPAWFMLDMTVHDSPVCGPPSGRGGEAVVHGTQVWILDHHSQGMSTLTPGDIDDMTFDPGFPLPLTARWSSDLTYRDGFLAIAGQFLGGVATSGMEDTSLEFGYFAAQVEVTDSP